MYHDVGSYTREYSYESNEPVFVGVNFRVSELTGAVLSAQLPRLKKHIKRLRRRRELFAEILSRSNRLKISPHNDPENAIGLTVMFDDPDEAKAFASHRGITRLIDTDRHVYTNWLPLLNQRTFDDRMNPFRLSGSTVTYPRDACARTLEILERTCKIALGAEFPLPIVYARAKQILSSLT
jgi:dTDP-4-amino-4,6-dideoxygalactose transaminase